MCVWLLSDREVADADKKDVEILVNSHGVGETSMYTSSYI